MSNEHEESTIPDGQQAAVHPSSLDGKPVQLLDPVVVALFSPETAQSFAGKPKDQAPYDPGSCMTELDQQLVDLKFQLETMKQELLAMKAGNAVAFAAISAALREIPNYEPKIMEAMLIHCLKHGWPLQGIPDNELTETAYSAPLRFLLNDQAQPRQTFRKKPEQ